MRLKRVSKFSSKVALSALISTSLAGCVTENYENDNSKPVVQNQSTNNEIAMTRISLGLGYLKMGNTTQAKLNLEKAKRFSPELVQVHTAFAHYYETVGEAELAANSFEDALKIESQDADTLNNYGVFLCRQEKYQEAETQILKAIAVPSYLLVSQSYENLALCHIKAKKYDKAEDAFDKAILHNPISANVYLQMMQLQYAKGDYKAGIRFLKKYEQTTRRFSPEALALAFKLYEKQRQIGTAKNYGAMLVKMFPGSFESKQYLLNGLDRIDADQMADDYRMSQRSSSSKNKKRVVVLSPKNNSVTASKPVTKKTSQSAKQPPSRVVKKQDVASTSQSVSKAASQTADAKTQVEKTPETVTQQVNTETATSLDNSKPSSKTVVKVQEEATPKATIRSISVPMHEVKKGDSLFYISTKYNIQIKALKRWNNLSGNKILRIGDLIYLSDPKKVSN